MHFRRFLFATTLLELTETITAQSSDSTTTLGLHYDG
jgi:hypothetical protein